MDYRIEQYINQLINKPGNIKKIYPIIQDIEMEYHEYEAGDRGFLKNGWLQFDVLLKTPIYLQSDLWDLYQFDWAWMVEEHIVNDLKLFGLRKLPYRLNIWSPKDTLEREIDGVNPKWDKNNPYIGWNLIDGTYDEFY